MVYNLGRLYHAIMQRYDYVPVGRRLVLTALGGAALGAVTTNLDRLVTKPVKTPKADATPVVAKPPIRHDIDLATALKREIINYAKAHGVPVDMPIMYGSFDTNDGISRWVTYDPTKDEFEVVRKLQSGTAQFSQDVGSNGSVKRALHFLLKDANPSGTPTIEEILKYAREKAVDVELMPAKSRKISNELYRTDMGVMRNALSGEIDKRAVGQ